MLFGINNKSARYLAITHDLMVSFFAFSAGHFLAFGYPEILYLSGILEKSLAFLIIVGFSIGLSGLHGGHWRYASITDMIAIAKAATLAVTIFTIANFMMSRAENLSRIAIVLIWVFMIFGLGAGRLIYRTIKERRPIVFTRQPPPHVTVTLLYPFSDCTDNFLRVQNRNHQHKLWPAGIIDDRLRMQGQKIHGVSVIGTRKDIPGLVCQLADKAITVRQLIITDPKVSGTEMTELLDYCNKSKISIAKLPDTQPIGPFNKPLEADPVKLEDLLGRTEKVNPNNDLGRFIAGRIVMVTGAGGSIGSELCRQIASAQPAVLILIEFSEHNLYTVTGYFAEHLPGVTIKPLIADIRNHSRMERIVREERPSVIFHAAALKHVPIVEENPWEAIKTNVIATAHLAKSALRNGVEMFVLISTDKAVNPTSIMGASKRSAELFCQSMDAVSVTTRFRIVRFGNVLGSAGSVVPRFQKQIASGGPVTVTDQEMTRYFMTTQEAVQLLLRAATYDIDNLSLKSCIFILDMGQPVKIVDLAKRLIMLAGFEPELEIPISFTGLRPGEKLHEELISDHETPVFTHVDNFVVAHSMPVSLSAVEAYVEDMHRLCQQEDNLEALKLLLRTATNYQTLTPFDFDQASAV
jgi:FlaA1/EpsC-like NDP-sugar epimerase